MLKSQILNILFLGDIVGAPGRRVVGKFLNLFSDNFNLVIANSENSAHGFGFTQKNYDELTQFGVNVFTGGNHTFDRKEVFSLLETYDNVLRPLNFPKQTPGKGYVIVNVDNYKIAILNILGRVFMEPLDSPFSILDQTINDKCQECDIILVDIHAEATAEKIAIGHYLDGRVTAIVGSHTHVQTADERILPKGTGFITDMGCCAAYNSVIGMAIPGVLRRMTQQLPTKFDIAEGSAQLSGVIISIDTTTQKCVKLKRVKFNEDTQDDDIKYFQEYFSQKA